MCLCDLHATYLGIVRRAVNSYVQSFRTLGQQLFHDIIQQVQLLKMNGLHDSWFRTPSSQLQAGIDLVNGVDSFSSSQSSPSNSALLRDNEFRFIDQHAGGLTPTGPRPQMPTMSPLRTPVSFTPRR